MDQDSDLLQSKAKELRAISEPSGGVLLAQRRETGANPAETPPTQELISKIIEKGQQNYKRSENYGSYKRVVVKKLSKDGKVKKEETNLYRTTWIEDHPYGELIRINDKELTKKEKEKEAKRRSESIKRIRTQDLKEILEYTGQDLCEKYDFTVLLRTRMAAISSPLSQKRKSCDSDRVSRKF